MANNPNYSRDKDPLKRAEYWLHALAWQRGDKFEMLEALAKEVEAERTQLKQQAQAAAELAAALTDMIGIAHQFKDYNEEMSFMGDVPERITQARAALSKWQATQGD